MSSTKLHSPYHKNQKDEILLRFDNSLIFHYVGISFKTQGLYFIVFVTRYLDLYKVILHPGKLADGLILYNSIMKVLYIALTLYICNMMMRVSPYRTTYDKNGDTYKVVSNRMREEKLIFKYSAKQEKFKEQKDYNYCLI